MPIYEYKCVACGHRFEVTKKYSDPDPECPECRDSCMRLYSNFDFILRGSGWAKDGYGGNKPG